MNVNNQLKSMITWSAVGQEPEHDGTYYVMGDGITGVEAMRRSDGKWDAKNNEDPWVFGSLKSDKYNFIKHINEKVTGLTAAQKKRAHLENVHQIVHMVGEDKESLNDKTIVSAVVFNDRHIEYFWNDLNDVKDDTVMFFFDVLDKSLQAKQEKVQKEVKPAPKTEEPKKAEPEVVKEEPKEDPKKVEKSVEKSVEEAPQEPEEPDLPNVESDPLPESLDSVDTDNSATDPSFDELPF